MPLVQERLGRLDSERLVYSLRKPTLEGRTELVLTPLEQLDRLAHLVTPPRVHKHRYCGGRRRRACRHGPPRGRALLGAAAGESSQQAGSRSDSIYECLLLLCTRCGEPMRIIAFMLDPPVIERILTHIGEPTS